MRRGRRNGDKRCGPRLRSRDRGAKSTLRVFLDHDIRLIRQSLC